MAKLYTTEGHLMESDVEILKTVRKGSNKYYIGFYNYKIVLLKKDKSNYVLLKNLFDFKD